jgi:hypothetical protein
MQYCLRTLLISMTFICIAVGGMVARWKLDQGNLNWLYRTAGIVSESPYWVPVVFGAYALGQRKMSMPLICTFAVAEAAAVCAVIWFTRLLTP